MRREILMRLSRIREVCPGIIANLSRVLASSFRMLTVPTGILANLSRIQEVCTRILECSHWNTRESITNTCELMDNTGSLHWNTSESITNSSPLSTCEFITSTASLHPNTWVLTLEYSRIHYEYLLVKGEYGKLALEYWRKFVLEYLRIYHEYGEFALDYLRVRTRILVNL